MSRIGIVMAVICTGVFGVSEPAWAQRPGEGPPLPAGQGTNPDVRSKQADPSAVEIPLYAGARVMDVLQALTDKGFLIKWNPKQIVPEMKLAERPRATRIDKLLAEILEPFGYRADRNQFDGGFRVRPMKSPKRGEVDVGDPSPPGKD